MFYTTFQYLFSLLPTILLIILFVAVFKMQGLGDKGKIYDAETTKSKIKFNDVAGLDEEKNEMIEIVDFLKEPKNSMRWVLKFLEEFYYVDNQVQEKL